MIRRGEGGWADMGTLRSPGGGGVLAFLHRGAQGTGRGRPSRPSLPHSTTLAPTEFDGLFVRLMPLGPINRHLRMCCPRLQYPEYFVKVHYREQVQVVKSGERWLIEIPI